MTEPHLPAGRSFGKKAGQRAPASKPKKRTFTAQFSGWCPECGDDIVADFDEVGYDQFDRVVHEDCL